MIETYKALLSFLDQNGMNQAAMALQEEMEQQIRENKKLKENESNKNIMKIINKALSDQMNAENKFQQQHYADEHNQYRNQTQQQAPKVLETQNIMQGLMNRLDEKLNAKIQRLFENNTFQRMVESTDVFHDISNMSFTNSFLNKNNPQSLIKTDQTSNSQENLGIPNFGKAQAMGAPQIQQKFGNFGQQPEIQNQKSHPNQNKNQEQNLNRPPSMEDIFMTEDDQMGSNKKNKIDQADQQGGAKSDRFGIPNDEEDQISIIKHEGNNESSDFLQNSNSIILDHLDDKQLVDQYIDDEDPGFDLYQVGEKDFSRVAKQLAEKFNFPTRACQNVAKREDRDKPEYAPPPSSNEEDSGLMLQQLKDKQGKIEKADPEEKDDKQDKRSIYLPEHLKHPPSNDSFYPVKYDKVIYDCFQLKVIFDRERTGFEETKEFPIVINSIIAGRYQIMQYLGSAAFSKAIQCLDLVTNKLLCMKIIQNNKDYFDQSIDEIQLLKYINYNGNVEEKNVLKVYDFFYHQEHLFIITELLKDNLYEFYKYNRENQQTPYFTLGRLQQITYQILIGLDYIHSLHLVHCDLKPENILMKSYSRCEVKIIDFGSSCFIHDHLSSYVQSRSYRAPEVIIGCKYDYKIDIWSLGCILAELWTGLVLFQNDNIQGLLARVIGIIGPFPEWMLKEGRLVNNFFTKEKLLYQEVYEDGGEMSQNMNDTSDAGARRHQNKTGRIQILVPKQSNLQARLKCEDGMFLDFVRSLLEIDRTKRPTAKQAMNHPWIIQSKYPDGLGF